VNNSPFEEPVPLRRGRLFKGGITYFNQYLTPFYFETIFKSVNFNKSYYDEILSP